MQRLLVNQVTSVQLYHKTYGFDIAVTSAMRKNARWSGVGVSGLSMGSLGDSMGLRSVQMNINDSNKKEVHRINRSSQ